MTHVTCRLTAENGDHLWNRTLGNRAWATFTFTFLLASLEYNEWDLLFWLTVCKGAYEKFGESSRRRRRWLVTVMPRRVSIVYTCTGRWSSLRDSQRLLSVGISRLSRNSHGLVDVERSCSANNATAFNNNNLTCAWPALIERQLTPGHTLDSILPICGHSLQSTIDKIVYKIFGAMSKDL